MIAALAISGCALAASTVTPAVATPASMTPANATSTPTLPNPSAAPDAPSADDGLWYYTDTGVAEIHDSGITGEGVTIAIIDSPINLDVPDLAGARIHPRTDQLCPGFTGVEATERARHSTAMASLLVGNGAGIVEEPGVLGVAPDAEILHYAVLGVAVNECDAPLADLVTDAVEQGADILNLSIAYDSPNDAQKAIDVALAAGLVVNVAVQNQSSDRLDLLSGMPGVVSIENVDQGGNPDEFSVTGPGLDLLAPGVGIRMLRTDFSGYELDDGTSPATAWVSGVFALAKSEWPDATGNQLIQAAIRSTTPEPTTASTELPPRTDSSGYGRLDPRILLATDPSQFPDENPLLEVGATADPTETPPVTPLENAPAASRFIWLVGGFVAVTGLYALLLVVRRRRYRRGR
ncbi:S8 family peptidase [Gulosibacter molinativorax]|nr:S8 family serine peptidase [Gulosibacter molinativorax]